MIYLTAIVSLLILCRPVSSQPWSLRSSSRHRRASKLITVRSRQAFCSSSLTSQRAAANGTLVNGVPRSDLTPLLQFPSTMSDSLVNGLWFTSLAFSLATALFAVLTKQWIHQYITVPSGTPRDDVMYVSSIHGAGAMGCGIHCWIVTRSPECVAWYISSGFGTFPGPTTSGDCICRWSHHIYILRCVLCQQLPAGFFTLRARTRHHCRIISFLFMHTSSTVLAASSPRSSHLPPSQPSQSLPFAHFEMLNVPLESNAEEMDVHALAWLFNMSSNPSVKTIVIQSTGILPPGICGVPKATCQRDFGDVQYQRPVILSY